MLIAEVSLYPLETPESDHIVFESLQALEDQNLQYDIGSLSTHITGDAEQVWSSLRSLHNRALASGHEVVMVITLSNTP